VFTAFMVQACQRHTGRGDSLHLSERHPDGEYGSDQGAAGRSQEPSRRVSHPQTHATPLRFAPMRPEYQSHAALKPLLHRNEDA
jgi:hypothetical protein